MSKHQCWSSSRLKDPDEDLTSVTKANCHKGKRSNKSLQASSSVLMKESELAMQQLISSLFW